MSRKRANNQVGVCNIIKRDSDNIPTHLTEARTYADLGNLSANLGTERDHQNGWCYLWNASVKINIPASNGDISSVSALDETGVIVSMTATFLTDHYEITGINGNYYWNIKCWATGITPTNAEKLAYTLEDSGGGSNLFTWFKACETSGTTAYKGYGDGVNGSIVNYYEGFHAQQDVYSFLDEDGYTDSSGILIPKDSSIITPLTDVLGNPLQYIGKVPTKAEIVGGKCWKGVTGSYYSITGLLTTDTIEVPTGSDLPTCTTNGQLVLANDSLAWDVVIKRSGVQWARLSFSESIKVPGSHIAYDIGVSGTPTGNHASLVNGSLSNEGVKTIAGDWLQNGVGLLGIFNQSHVTSTEDVVINSTMLSIKFRIVENMTATSTQVVLLENASLLSTFAIGSMTMQISPITNKLLFALWSLQGSSSSKYIQYEYDELIAGDYILDIDTDLVGTGIFKLYRNSIQITGNQVVDNNVRGFNILTDTYRFGARGDLGEVGIYAKIQGFEFTNIFKLSDDLSNPVDKLGNYTFTAFNITQEIIPASAALDGTDALGNPLTIPQDGYSFLNCGSSLEMCRTPRIVNSDRGHFWFISKDTDNFIKRQVTPYDLAVENLVSDQLFCNTNEN